MSNVTTVQVVALGVTYTFTLIDGKLFIVFGDDGHGMGTSGKRSPVVPELGRQIRENEFNSAVVARMAPKFRSVNVNFVEVAPGVGDVPLSTRTKLANAIYHACVAKVGKANVKAVYLSIHFDALNGVFGSQNGHSIFVFPGASDSLKLATNVSEFLRQGTTQTWRGIKSAEFWVLEETAMTAMLSENGFMDNHREALLMVNTGFQEEVASEHFKGTMKFFGLTTTVAPATPQTGSEVITTPSAPSNGTHTVVKGDTLWSISRKYNVSVAQIEKLNPGIDADSLEIGSKINVGAPTLVPPYVPASNGVTARVKALAVVPIRRANSHNSEIARYTKVGEVFDVYVNSNDWHNVGGAHWILGENGKNLALVRDEAPKPAPKPAPAPAKKEYAYFPPGHGTWSVYPTNKQPVKANAIGAINPTKYNGLTYEVLGKPYANVVTIRTGSWGVVNIFVGDTNSKLIWK